jgi:hypothetical protein
MNDNGVPGMSDGLEITVTAEDYAKLRELSKTSDITHCICCPTPASGGDVWNLRWASRANIEHCVRDGSHNMARRTRCARGLAYTPEDARMSKSGGRPCVTCVGEDCRRRYAHNSYCLKEEARRRCARSWVPFKEAA